MKLTNLLPGAAVTEKPLVTGDPCHGVRSQPGIPGKGLSVWEMSAEQLLQRSSSWVGIALLLYLFSVDT